MITNQSKKAKDGKMAPNNGAGDRGRRLRWVGSRSVQRSPLAVCTSMMVITNIIETYSQPRIKNVHRFRKQKHLYERGFYETSRENIHWVFQFIRSAFIFVKYPSGLSVS